MLSDSLESNEYTNEELVRLLGVYTGETLTHYGLWFARSVDHVGLSATLEAEEEVIRRYGPTALRRFPTSLNNGSGSIETALERMDRDGLVGLLQDAAKTWLASDGFWFQALEGRFGMAQTKVVNDACWAEFARMEAFKLRTFLRPGEEGMRALERTLKLRIYSSINECEAHWENDKSLVWTMVDCRVQAARNRKGLDPYPCRSAGVNEYTAFSAGIDSRIVVDCISCPPGPVPQGGWCQWRFTLR
ncbi:MAG: DUF6125 family protein [Pseudomonadota bacterium]